MVLTMVAPSSQRGPKRKKQKHAQGRLPAQEQVEGEEATRRLAIAIYREGHRDVLTDAVAALEELLGDQS